MAVFPANPQTKVSFRPLPPTGCGLSATIASNYIFDDTFPVVMVSVTSK